MRRPVNQGYSLLELLAVLAITGVIIAALGGLLLSGYRACQRVDYLSEIQENARVGLEMMIRDIKSCRSINQVNDDSFSLIGSDGSKLSYQVSAGTLYRAGKGTSNPVCNEAKELLIKRILPDLLEITLITGNQEYDYHLTTRVKRVTD